MALIACLRCTRVVKRDGRGNPRFCAACALGQMRECWSATRKVSQAIKAGVLTTVSGLMCADCGALATCYDHRDYTKPLEVDPVCTRCNSLRGPAFSSAYRPAVVLGCADVAHAQSVDFFARGGYSNALKL